MSRGIIQRSSRFVKYVAMPWISQYLDRYDLPWSLPNYFLNPALWSLVEWTVGCKAISRILASAFINIDSGENKRVKEVRAYPANLMRVTANSKPPLLNFSTRTKRIPAKPANIKVGFLSFLCHIRVTSVLFINCVHQYL